MLTKEQNELLTQTAPETPTGRWLRRYWWPISAVSELDEDPVRPVRLLGEDLILFRDESGKLGLVTQRCAHRGISLAYGIPQSNGLRCAYHGWVYNSEGQVVDMPFEPACLPLKITAYPVQALGGLIWAYLGPTPVPLLPRWEALVRDDLNRKLIFKKLPCNWVQCMDNSADPVHFEHLHGHYGDYYGQRHGFPTRLRAPGHKKIAFDVFEYGFYKRRLIEGDPEDSDDWTVGHPLIFPYILCVGPGDGYSYQIRVPMDDTNTLHILLQNKPVQPGEAVQESIPLEWQEVGYTDLGLVDAPGIIYQDEMAWIGQGAVSDRENEHLVTSDQGVILYHNLIWENIQKVERGEDPMGVIRDPAKNEPMITFRRERGSNKLVREPATVA